MNERNAGRFLSRWSRRKRHHRDAGPSGFATRDAATARPVAKPEAASGPDPFDDFDFDSLNFSSDFKAFMAGGVSAEAQRKALRKLWTSTDIIAQTDDLDDYLEDFREEAMAQPAELVRSAYRIGRGFAEDDGREKGAVADKVCETAEERPGEPQVPSGGDDTTQADSRAPPARLNELEKSLQDSGKRQT